MAKIERLYALINALRKAKRKFGPRKPSVVVGYRGVNYAVYVHENLKAKHKAPTQAKFLEQPARQNAKQIAQVITSAMQVGATLEQSLKLGGLRLQRESQRLVPVDTGNLKNSAFIDVERK